jgi:hypothetical protein
MPCFWPGQKQHPARPPAFEGKIPKPHLSACEQYREYIQEQMLVEIPRTPMTSKSTGVRDFAWIPIHLGFTEIGIMGIYCIRA